MSLSHHHPSEDALLAYAAGTLDEATSVLIATHLSLCPACRATMRAAEEIGGELMETIRPAVSVATSVDDILKWVEHDPVTLHRDVRHGPARNGRPANRADTLLPEPLRSYVEGDLDSLKWQWMGPGVRYVRIFGDEDGAKVGLMKIASGTRMPNHGHAGEEFTMVLAGGYRDAMGSYRRGDVEVADSDVVHQPVADNDGDCICLVVTRGALRPTGLFAKALQPLMRM
ncbi:MAG: ChrR family anti-sigma-E factor [Rhodospirillaceae bacterium]|nr:ChrR family anti-sigma-E factor [Rhodospirillaceae bacterium]